MTEQLGLLSESVCKKTINYRKEPISDHYTVEQRPFARGKFATVRRCRHKGSGVEYAAKSMRKRRRACDVRHEIVHEAHVLEMSSSHPHIVQLHEVYETPSEIVLVLELVEGGELQRVLDDEEVVGEREATRLLTQILAGVSFLHDHNIAHLDLKPQNLLLTKAFPEGEVKLCDFGISRLITKGIEIREIVGTPDYVAPEVLHYEPISLATDMWSIGILTYVLLSGHSPFGGDTKQETFCNITRGTLEFPSDLFGNISSNAKDFICRLLVRDPRGRMSAEDCFKHPWLCGTDAGIKGIQLTLTPDKNTAVSDIDSSPATNEKKTPSPRIQNRSKIPEFTSPAINGQSSPACKSNGTTEKPPVAPISNKSNGTTENSSISPTCNSKDTEKPPVAPTCNKVNGTGQELKNGVLFCRKSNGINPEPNNGIPFCRKANSIDQEPKSGIPFCRKFSSTDRELKNNVPLCRKSIGTVQELKKSSLYCKFNGIEQDRKKSPIFCRRSSGTDVESKTGTALHNKANGLDPESKKGVNGSPFCNKSGGSAQESKNGTTTTATTRSVDTMVARFEGLSMSKRIVFSEEIIVDERVGMVY